LKKPTGQISGFLDQTEKVALEGNLKKSDGA